MIEIFLLLHGDVGKIAAQDGAVDSRIEGVALEFPGALLLPDFQLLQYRRNLVMDIHPFGHPPVREEVGLAEFSHPVLGFQGLPGVVIFVPYGEERHKIG